MRDVIFFAQVKARENQAEIWTESVGVISASASGAGFYAAHRCFVGQVLSLMMPMPAEFRRYDKEKKFYKIWGLVQHCNSLADDSGNHIGVAFIGPSAPESYTTTPMTSYRVSGIGPDGFWIVSQTEKPFKSRKHTRFQGALEVQLTIFNPDGTEQGTETALTENICETGAAVFSNAPLDVGEFITFSSTKHNFQTTAMVRNRQYGDDNRPRLHIEFIDALFPTSQLADES